MKKRVWILLILAALLLIPHVASANAPAPNPWEIKVSYTNVPEDAKIDVFAAGVDGAFRQLETHTVKQGKSFCFYMEQDDTQFYLLLTASDGTETRSNTAGLEEYESYTYDGSTNLLEVKTGSSSGDSGLGDSLVAMCETGAKIALTVLARLILPFILTLLLEWLAALCFGVRPVRYVFAINLLTNPLMNLLLIAMTMIGSTVYWIALVVLELAVVGIEYWFYTKKYRDLSHKRLLLFTITANLISLAAGLAMQTLLL